MKTFDYLMGKSLAEAKLLLNSINLEYTIIETKGVKDKDVLVEPYVLRVEEIDGVVALTTGLFKTTI